MESSRYMTLPEVKWAAHASPALPKTGWTTTGEVGESREAFLDRLAELNTGDGSRFVFTPGQGDWASLLNSSNGEEWQGHLTIEEWEEE